MKRKIFSTLIALSMLCATLPGVGHAIDTPGQVKVNCTDSTDNLTNVGEKGIIEFEFNASMNPDTLTKENIDLTLDDIGVEYDIAYATEKGFAIDLGSLEGNKEYTLTFTDGCETADNESTFTESAIEFSTGNIIDLPYKEGKIIENIALNKKVLYGGLKPNTSISQKPISEILLNGDRSDTMGGFQKGSYPIIDLGAYYSPVAVRVTAGRKANGSDICKLNFWGKTSIELNEDGTPTNESLGSYDKGGVLFHNLPNTNEAKEQDDKIVPITGAEDLAEYGPIRYVYLERNAESGSVWIRELEIYAYVDVVVGPIEVDNENIPAADESYTFSASIEDYKAADTNPYMIAMAYDANGKVVAIDVAPATVPQVTATVTATDDTVGVTAMVVEDLSTMALIADPVTIGDAPASTSASASGVAIESSVDKISFSVMADNNISQNTAFAAFVIMEDDNITGNTVADAFKTISQENLETATILFAIAAKVEDGAEYEISDIIKDKSYFINIVANGKEKVVAQRKQKILGESGRNALIAAVVNADEETIADAIEDILEVEAISKDVIDYDDLRAKLEDERFPQMLVEAIEQIGEENVTFETIVEAIDSAQEALRADDEGKMLQKVLDADITQIKNEITNVVYTEKLISKDLITYYDDLEEDLGLDEFLEILLVKKEGVTSATPEAIAKIINDAQVALRQQKEDELVNDVLDAQTKENILAAVKKAIAGNGYAQVSSSDIYKFDSFQAMLDASDFDSYLLYVKDMLKSKGSVKPSLKAIADIANATQAVYALSTCNIKNESEIKDTEALFKAYGALFGNAYASAAKMAPMAQIFQAKKDTVNSGATLEDAIKWSSALSVLSGAENTEVAKAFKDYATMYGIDTEAAEDADVSYDAIASQFDRSNLLNIYGEDAFNKEFNAALQEAAGVNSDVNGSEDVEGEFGSLTGGVQTGRGPGGGGGGGGSSDEPKPTPTPTPTPTPAPTSGFSDMKSFAWAEEAVANLVEEGVVSGNEKGQFEPSRSVTRGEFVKMLVVASKIKVSEGTSIHFIDVPDSSWQHPYVQIAFSRGICRGTDEYTFNVNGTITRQDMAVMLTNLLNYLGVNSGGDAIEFTDTQNIADYAISAVETAAKAGLINGFDDGSFKPRESTRRVDAAMVISKLMEKIN